MTVGLTDCQVSGPKQPVQPTQLTRRCNRPGSIVNAVGMERLISLTPDGNQG
jgi:hypothetical protein